MGVFEDRVDRYVEPLYQRDPAAAGQPARGGHLRLRRAAGDAERLAEEPKYGYLDLYNREMEKACPGAGAYFVDSSFILEAHPEWYNVDGRHPREEYYPMWLTYLADLAGLNHD